MGPEIDEMFESKNLSVPAHLLINDLKIKSTALLRTMERIPANNQNAQLLAVANTHLMQVFMWAEKAISRAE